MEYPKIIERQIKFIDKILEELKILPLFENPNFHLDEMSSNNYLKFNYIFPEHINLSFVLSLYGIDIDVGGLYEVYQFNLMDINKKEDEIRKKIKTLFCSEVIVETCNKGKYVKLSFYDKNKDYIMSFKNISGFCSIFIKKKCRIEKYKPIAIVP